MGAAVHGSDDMLLSAACPVASTQLCSMSSAALCCGLHKTAHAGLHPLQQLASHSATWTQKAIPAFLTSTMRRR